MRRRRRCGDNGHVALTSPLALGATGEGDGAPITFYWIIH